MAPKLRIYDTEKAANDAASRLTKAGYRDHMVIHAGKVKGKEAAAVQTAIDKGQLSDRYIQICTSSLKEGCSLVSADAPFGQAARVLAILEKKGTVKTDLLRRYVISSPTPLSDALGLATLSTNPSTTGLLRHDWALSSKFGMGLLSSNPAPLSRMFGMKLLSAPKKGWRSSFGMPLLSSNAAPLSSMFGMKTVSKSKKGWNTSFGMPLLSNNPAPFSNLFGLRVLSKKSKKKWAQSR